MVVGWAFSIYLFLKTERAFSRASIFNILVLLLAHNADFQRISHIRIGIKSHNADLQGINHKEYEFCFFTHKNRNKYEEIAF
jgi:cell shape-determining protein MreC